VNLLLDFDGVLFDSSLELTTIIILTYLHSFPNSNIAKSLSDKETPKILANIEKYDPYRALETIKKENYKLNSYFKKFRTYCIDVDDFFVTSHYLEQNFFHKEKLTYKYFNTNFYYKYKKNLKENFYDLEKKFINIFYDSRKYLKDSNKTFWIILNEPFEKELNFIKKYSNKFDNLGILSTKQKYAILEILEYYKIDIIDNTNVFAKENEFINKGQKIIEVSKIWKTNVKDIHFVDDLLENLIKIKEANKDTNLYMSKWGYNNYEHRLIAKKNNIKIINSLTEVIHKEGL